MTGDATLGGSWALSGRGERTGEALADRLQHALSRCLLYTLEPTDEIRRAPGWPRTGYLNSPRELVRHTASPVCQSLPRMAARTCTARLNCQGVDGRAGQLERWERLGKILSRPLKRLTRPCPLSGAGNARGG